MCPASAKVLQSRRREARQRHALYELLQRLPAPFGAQAEQQYRPLSIWWEGSATAQDGRSTRGGVGATCTPKLVDWGRMPAAIDPVALLDNVHNTTRRKGVPVEQQVATLSFSSPVAATPSVAADGSTAAQPAVQASRGQQKRWQVETFAAVLRVLLPEDAAAGQNEQSQSASNGTGQEDRTSVHPQGQQAASSTASRPLYVVDFGCGTGGLMLPLAWMFPSCVFVGVEMKRPALQIVEARAKLAGLANVRCHLGMIEDYDGPLDVALGLHACGNATDQVMLLAQQRQAAIVVSPCCVGKLKFSMQGGSSFSPHIRTWHALLPPAPPSNAPGPPSEPALLLGSAPQHALAGTDTADASTAAAAPPTLPALTHPRSLALRSALGPDPEKHFKLMASVADTNFLHAAPQGAAPTALQDGVGNSGDGVPGQGGGSAGADGEADVEERQAPVVAPSDEDIGRCCKLHVELDRLQAAREAGYTCALHRTLHAGSMAKGDLLVAVPCGGGGRHGSAAALLA